MCAASSGMDAITVSDYGSRVCNYDRSCLNNRRGFDEYCPEHIRQTGWSRPCRAIDCEDKCAPGVLLCQAHMDERNGTAKKEKEKVCVYCGGGNVERSAPGINPMREGARDIWAHDQGHTAAAGCILELAKRVKALEDAMEELDSSFRAGKSTRTLSAILNSSPVGRRAAILATKAKRHEKEDKNNPGS